jgi:hypothetical protein
MSTPIYGGPKWRQFYSLALGNKQSNLIDEAGVVHLTGAASISPICWSRELCRHILERHTENIAHPLNCV